MVWGRGRYPFLSRSQPSQASHLGGILGQANTTRERGLIPTTPQWFLSSASHPNPEKWIKEQQKIFLSLQHTFNFCRLTAQEQYQEQQMASQFAHVASDGQEASSEPSALFEQGAREWGGGIDWEEKLSSEPKNHLTRRPGDGRPPSVLFDPAPAQCVHGLQQRGHVLEQEPAVPCCP